MCIRDSSEAGASNLIQKNAPGASQTPKAPDRFAASKFATGLGEISAMAMDEAGTLFTVDMQKGRLYRLEDRDKDGKLDILRTIAAGWAEPKGIAIIEDRIFVSDKNGVWEITQYGRFRLASFENVKGLSETPLIFADVQGESLLAVLTSENSNSQIVKIDVTSGFASRISGGKGPITAITQSINSDIWVAVEGRLLPIKDETYNAENGYAVTQGTEITSILLPGQYSQAPDVFSDFEDHIYISVGGANKSTDARQVKVINTQMGIPQGQGETLVDSFVSRTGLTAWGYPCLLYTSPSPRDATLSRMPSSA